MAEEKEELAPKQEDNAKVVRQAGRGFLVITGAKAWFFVAAFALNFGLPVLLRDPAEYGIYSVVVNAVSLLNMVVITGTIQAMSKIIAERPEQAPSIVRKGLFMQAFLGLPLAAIYASLAGPIAAGLREPQYAPLLRISAGVIAAYSFYAVFVGTFNGLKAFTKQASLDIIFATLRTGVILAIVALGYGVMGAIVGFVLASVIILLIAGFWVWRSLRTQAKPEEGELQSSNKRIFVFLVSTMLYTFALNLVMRVDLFALKRFSADALAGSNDQAEGISNALAGAYSLMLNIGRVPYQAVIAVAFVIFPLLSRSVFESERERTRSYVAGTMRYSLMIVGLLAAVLVGAGPDLVRPLYPAYAYASGVLLPVGLGYAFFALSYVAATMLIAAGRSWLAVGLTLAVVIALAILCFVMAGNAAPGSEILLATGWAVFIAMAGGFVLMGAVLYRLYGAFIPLKSGLRLGFIIALIVLVGRLTDFGNFVAFDDPSPVLTKSGVMVFSKSMLGSRLMWLLAALGKAAGLALLFVIALVATREVSAADKARVMGVLSRKKKSTP